MSQVKVVEDSHAGAQHFCDLVRPTLTADRQQRILVAGCGPAHEALHIRQDLGIPVIGVDIEPLWDPACGTGVDDFELSVHSVLDLPFPDNSFDIVFYHHVIEHVSDPVRSLEELHRVLVPGGMIYVGCPNRHRAVGYIGGYGATTAEKLRWNWADYKTRFKGRFRNEYGAHAGFTEKELVQLLRGRFTNIRPLSAEYIKAKYGGRLPASFLNLICQPPLRDVALPSVYATARKLKNSPGSGA